MLVHREACERNKGPILEVLRREFAAQRAGARGRQRHRTARRALRRPSAASHLAAERGGGAPATARRADAAGGAGEPARADRARRARAPLARRRRRRDLQRQHAAHHGARRRCGSFFRGAGAALLPEGVLCVYGPFNYQGRYTSDSNAQFDRGSRHVIPQRAARLRDRRRTGAAAGTHAERRSRHARQQSHARLAAPHTRVA